MITIATANQFENCAGESTICRVTHLSESTVTQIAVRVSVCSDRWCAFDASEWVSNNCVQ